jgi:hypothetical protein
MPAWSKVLGDRPIRDEKPLGMPWGFEPLHPPLPLAGGVVRVLGTVVEVPMLAVLYSRADAVHLHRLGQTSGTMCGWLRTRR